MKAFCFTDGVIHMARKVPDGALLIVSAPARLLRSRIEATARHAYDSRTFLVPEIPEAKTGGEAIVALIQYRAFVQKTLTGEVR